MDCDVCGKPAAIHLTCASPSGKTEAHYCLDHADRAGLSQDQVRETRRQEAAMLAFVSFVEANKRVPSTEEMVQIGVLTEPGARLDSETKDFLRRAAELVLAEQGDSNRTGSS